jgi:hypothetical protein
MVWKHCFLAEGVKTMRKLFASASIGAIANTFANTMSGGKLFVCATPQPIDLTQSEYEALVWVQVKGVGSHGETGTTQNIVGYDTWDQVFTDKDKGIANAGDPEVEVARIDSDPGQNIMITAAAALNKSKYAFKIEYNDAPAGGLPTRFYNRGVVTGPRHPHGRNEDFDLEMYQLGLVQEQVKVESSAIALGGTPAGATENAAYTFTPTISGQTGAVTYTWNGTNLAEYGFAINASTGAITSADPLKPGTVVGTIVAVDSVGQRGVMRVSITVAAA